MQSWTMALIFALTLFTSSLSLGQSKHSSAGDLIARFSYDGADAPVDWRYQEGYPQICFALFRDGYYRISRMTEYGSEKLQGSLSERQVARVTDLLKNLDFENQNKGGLIRRGAKSLVVQIARHGEPLHYVWIDPDRERPFPQSAMSIVNWLQDFTDQGATPLTLHELSDEPICPPASEKPLQPAVAGLEGTSAGAACEARPPR